MGDANLDSMKWNKPKFQKKVAIIHKNILQQWGLHVHEIGIAYLADHAQLNQEIAQIALDNFYMLPIIIIKASICLRF